MSKKPDASDRELDEACRRVGRFMHDFAKVETEMNEAIVGILRLKGHAAELLHSIDFLKKLNILRTITMELVSDEERAGIEDLFRLTFRENDNRTMLAHSPFRPTTGGGVEFRRVTAKNGKITKQKCAWTPDQFSQSSANLSRIKAGLWRIQPSLTIGLGEEGLTTIRRGGLAYTSEELTRWEKLGSQRKEKS